MTTQPHEKYDRNREIYRLNTEVALTYGELAKRYGMRRQGIHQIIKRYTKKYVVGRPTGPSRDK